jgi:hypothetical protein
MAPVAHDEDITPDLELRPFRPQCIEQGSVDCGSASLLKHAQYEQDEKEYEEVLNISLTSSMVPGLTEQLESYSTELQITSIYKNIKLIFYVQKILQFNSVLSHVPSS